MNSSMKNLIILFSFPILLLRKIYYWNISDKSRLPGREFAEYGFKLGRRLFLIFRFSPKLILNPVSIVRYFEFDFIYKSMSLNKSLKILDVSSPYLFGFFIHSKYQSEYHYCNPDKKDLANVNSLKSKINFGEKYSTKSVDILKSSFDDESFDRIVSISVIEHISGKGDSIAMREMWRILKPEGLLCLSFPVKKIFEEEYRQKDEYNLHLTKESGKYFFQRFYDAQNIEQRLLSSISDFEIINKKIFGSRNKDFYSAYQKRWQKYSYWETVKDPYHISKHFSNFENLKELEDFGVMGLIIRKLK